MSEFGYHTQGGTNDNISNNVVWLKSVAGGGSPATPASNGTLTTISVYSAQKAGTPTMNAALYSDNGSGAPKDLLGYGTAQAVSTAFTWLNIDLSTANVSVVSGTQYWFAVMIPAGDNAFDANVKFDGSSGVTELYFTNSTQYTGVNGGFPSSRTSTVTGTAAERWSVYGTYTPAAGGTVVFGGGFPLMGVQ